MAKEIANTIHLLCNKVEIARSIRRKKATVGDIDFVVVATDCNWSRIVQALKKSKLICAGKSVIKLNYPLENSPFEVDFYRATEPLQARKQLISLMFQLDFG